MFIESQTIELKVSLFKFLITLLLGGNTGLLGLLIRFGWKNYRKYKDAIMVFIEEHEKLVDDFLLRHPEELSSYPNYFSKLPKSKNKSHHIIKKPHEVRHTKAGKSDDLGSDDEAED